MGKASFCHIQDMYGRLQSYVSINDLGEEAYAEFIKQLKIAEVDVVIDELNRQLDEWKDLLKKGVNEAGDKLSIEEVANINKMLPTFKQIRNIEIKKNEFEKTTTRKIIRYKLS